MTIEPTSPSQDPPPDAGMPATQEAASLETPLPALTTQGIAPTQTDPSIVPQKRARIWTVWVTLAATVFLYAIVSQLGGLIGIVYVEGGLSGLSENQDPDALFEKTLKDPLALAVTLLPGQLMLLLTPLAVVAISQQGIRQRIGLHAGRWSFATMLLIAATAPLISLLTSLVMDPLFEPSPHLEVLTSAFRDLGQQGFFWLLILLVGVTPAVCEEFLMRGYVQRGFMRRWPAFVSILVSAMLFAALHVDPMHVIAVLPLGIWLGVLAHTSRSLWAAVLGHMLNNVASVISSLPEDTGAFDLPPPLITIPVIGFGLLGFALFVYQVRRVDVSGTARAVRY